MAFPASIILHLNQLKHITQTCIYLYSKYQSSSKLLKIRCIIKTKINLPDLVINFSPKALGCLRLIFVPVYIIFFYYFKGVHNLIQNETCAMSA